MITKEQIKAEVDKIRDEHLALLYRIIKALEIPIEESTKSVRAKGSRKASKKTEWHQFIQETYGCLSAAPIERGDQGIYEFREVIE